MLAGNVIGIYGYLDEPILSWKTELQNNTLSVMVWLTWEHNFGHKKQIFKARTKNQYYNFKGLNKV